MKIDIQSFLARLIAQNFEIDKIEESEGFSEDRSSVVVITLSVSDRKRIKEVEKLLREYPFKYSIRRGRKGRPPKISIWLDPT